jgi:hypothetical protein
MKNKKLWFMRIDLWKQCLKTGGSKFCETWRPWKPPNWTFFLNSENQGDFQNGKCFFFLNEEEQGRFLEPDSKIGI